MKAQHANDLIARLAMAEEATQKFLLDHLENKPADLNVTQLLIVWRLDNCGPLRSGNFYDQCYPGTNASYNLNVLIKKGYAVSSKRDTDKRMVTIELTDKGRSLAAEIEQVMSYLENDLEKHFPAAAFRELVRWTEMTGHTIPATKPTVRKSA